MSSLTLVQQQSLRWLAMLCVASVIYMFVNVVGLRLLLDQTVHFWNYTDPEISQGSNATPGEFGRITVAVILLLTGSDVFQTIVFSLLIRILLPENYLISRHVLSFFAYVWLICAIMNSTVQVYGLAFPEKTSELQFLLEVNWFWWLLLMYSINMGFSVLGVAVYHARTLPHSLARLMILAGIAGILLNFAGSDPNSSISQANLSMLPYATMLVLLAAYLMIATMPRSEQVTTIGVQPTHN